MKKINIGIVGLGRMGKEYAKNLAFKIRSANLVAACSIVPEELAFAKNELGITNIYEDYEQMLQQQDLEAIFVISSTNQHAEHIIKALQAGLHVFSEKPLAITPEACRQVEKVALQHPQQLVVVGLSLIHI